MGDHRASIKIQMEFHGIKDKTDMYINYIGHGGEVDGVDDRIIEFCRSVYERGIGVYEKRMDEYYREQNKERIEKEEKAELARLKAKYNDSPQSK